MAASKKKPTAASLLDHARRVALALPETSEEPHFDMTSFRVKGKIFATVPPTNERIHVFVAPDVVHAFVAERPRAFEELWWGKNLSGVRVLLPAATEAEISELLETAWRAKAPKRVAAAYDASQGDTDR